MMNPAEDEALFKATYAEIEADPESFYSQFYVNFLNSSKRVQKAFERVDIISQHMMLRRAMIHIVEFARTGSISNEIKKIAEAHIKLQIDADLFELFTDTLIKTLYKFCRIFTPAHEATWRRLLTPTMALMMHHRMKA